MDPNICCVDLSHLKALGRPEGALPSDVSYIRSSSTLRRGADAAFLRIDCLRGPCVIILGYRRGDVAQLAIARGHLAERDEASVRTVSFFVPTCVLSRVLQRSRGRRGSAVVICDVCTTSRNRAELFSIILVVILLYIPVPPICHTAHAHSPGNYASMRA